MRVYLSGPMSGIADNNFPAFHERAAPAARARLRCRQPRRDPGGRHVGAVPARRHPRAVHLRRHRADAGLARTSGVCDHIRKELVEVEESGGSLAEWTDVIILALDGAWRSGASPEEIIAAVVAKQTKNEGRRWPDWRTADTGKAIEHVRDGADAVAS